MIDAVDGENYRVGRLSGATNQLLVALLVTALMSGPIVILYLLAPGSLIVLMVPICFLVALEGIMTTRWLSSDARRGTNRLHYRLAEWAFILLFLRLTTWVAAEGLPDLVTMRGYIFSPLTFFDLRFVVLAVVAFFAWERALTLSNLISQISLNEAELHYYSLPAQERAAQSSDRPVDAGRQAHFASLMNNWLAGAVVLIICAAVSTVRIPTSALEEAIDLRSITRLGLQPGVMLSIVVYFLAGLWLIARQRMIILRSRWIIGGVRVQTGFERIWYGASLLILLGIAMIAGLLPIGSTTLLATIMAALGGAVIFVSSLIIALFSGLVYLLLNLLGLAEEPAPATAMPAMPVPTPTPVAQPAELSETAAFVLGSTFWLVVGAVVLVAVLFYLRGRGKLPGRQTLRLWWDRARAWLGHICRRLGRQATAAGVAIRARVSRREKSAGQTPASPRFVRLNALQAREQILYFYLSTARRAAEQGLARKKHATPLEYAGELKEGWPEVEAEIDELTNAFLQARYSAAPISEHETSPARLSWKRVRATIKRRRR